MHQFKVGDRITLTGFDWSNDPKLYTGQVVTILDVDADGSLQFVGYEKNWWDVTAENWEVELNTDTPSEHFAKTAAKFASESLTYPDIESLNTLREQLGISSFEQSVRRHTDRIATLLIEKNKSYGDSALNPVRIFSKADRMEQLYIRLDDKISRVKSGHEYPGDDTIQDIIGYCVLILIARESE